MRLHVHHRTSYRYDEPALRLVQALRLWPHSSTAQFVRGWRVDVDGRRLPATGQDGFGNLVATHAWDQPVQQVVLEVDGIVETQDTHGVHGTGDEVLPPAFFLTATALTDVDEAIRSLARDDDRTGAGTLDRLHGLSSRIRDRVEYTPQSTHVATTAAEALAAGAGVCQDHAHLMVACARVLGIPARYVSGYLCAGDDGADAASHAWVEAWVEDLGWVGFDPANRVSPDPHYVRVAVGRDYADAAPVRGIRQGGVAETLEVLVRVSQGQANQ